MKRFSLHHRFLLSFYSVAAAVLFGSLLLAPADASSQTDFSRTVIKKTGRGFAAVSSFESAAEVPDSLPPNNTWLPHRQRATVLPSVFPQSHTKTIQAVLELHLSRPPPVPPLS